MCRDPRAGRRGRYLPGQEREQRSKECVRAVGVHVVPGLDGHQRRIGDAASKSFDLVLWKMAASSASNDQGACRDEVQVLPPGTVRVVALVGDGAQDPPVKRQRFRWLARHHSWWRRWKRRRWFLQHQLPDQSRFGLCDQVGHRCTEGVSDARSPLRDGECEGIPARPSASTPANSPPDVNCLRAHASRLRTPRTWGSVPRSPWSRYCCPRQERGEVRREGVRCLLRRHMPTHNAVRFGPRNTSILTIGGEATAVWSMPEGCPTPVVP